MKINLKSIDTSAKSEVKYYMAGIKDLRGVLYSKGMTLKRPLI